MGLYQLPASAPRWVPVTKSYTDFSTAGLTSTIDIYTLPAKGCVHAIQIYASTLFSGGIIATYTLSVGKTGDPVYYVTAKNVFTGAPLPQTTFVFLVDSMTATTTMTATAISTVGNLNAATAGSVTFYLLLSTLQ